MAKWKYFIHTCIYGKHEIIFILHTIYRITVLFIYIIRKFYVFLFFNMRIIKTVSINWMKTLSQKFLLVLLSKSTLCGMGTLTEISALPLHIVHTVLFTTKAIMLETHVYLKFFLSVWKVQTGAKKAYHAGRVEKRKITSPSNPLMCCLCAWDTIIDHLNSRHQFQLQILYTKKQPYSKIQNTLQHPLIKC